MSNCNIELKTLLLQGLSEPEFYGDLVYNLQKIIGKNDLPYHCKMIIVRYKKKVITQMFCNRRHVWLLIQQLC